MDQKESEQIETLQKRFTICFRKLQDVTLHTFCGIKKLKIVSIIIRFELNKVDV